MTNLKRTLKIWSLVIALLVVGGYSLYEFHNVIIGPVINIYEPSDGATIENPIVEVKGQAKNVSEISLNDRQITVDEAGNFADKVVLSPGFNVIKLSVSDKFGRRTEKQLELVLTQHESLVSTESQELN
jgi:hypothetical protein